MPRVIPVVAFSALAGLLCAQGKPEDLINYFKGELERSADNVTRVLRQYNQLETRGEFDAFARLRIHDALVDALRAIEDPVLARRAAGILASWSSAELPMKVVVLKAMLGSRFSMPREDRIAQFAALARGRDFRLSVWGIRLLGDSRWPAAVDALIDILRTEEASGTGQSVLWNIVSAELYRVLGVHAPQGATSGQVAQNWEKLGKKLPKDADHTPASGDGRTVTFFGDMISPRAMFCIDVSSSMLQEATLADAARARTATAGEGGARRREQKITIVKSELERCLKRLQSWHRFNVLAYCASLRPWNVSGGVRLQPASGRNIDSAVAYARGLEVGRGTNIHDAVKTSLPVDELETIYLLSDGEPSVGGDKGQIERMLRAENYLRAVRVVTYGFTPEGSGSFDEEFMRRIARNNWGWYRRLNR